MKERKRVLTESQLRKEKRRAAQDATGRVTAAGGVMRVNM